MVQKYFIMHYIISSKYGRGYVGIAQTMMTTLQICDNYVKLLALPHFSKKNNTGTGNRVVFSASKSHAKPYLPML